MDHSRIRAVKKRRRGVDARGCGEQTYAARLVDVIKFRKAQLRQ
jgi:hypothetical protein